MFLLYCDDLELNLQYLWGMPVFSCVDTISAVLHYFVQTIFPIWCHFHSAWRTSFGISWVKICCWWILSSFVCLRKYLFCLWKRFSLLIEFCLTVLSLQTLTMLLHHLLTCIIPSEKSAVIFIFVLVHHNMSLLLPNARLLATFVILLFIITVEQFEYDVFLCNFFLFVCLFCFGFTELLALWVDGYFLLLFAKFGKVLAVISSSIFFFLSYSSPSLLSSPSATPYRYIKLLDYLILKFFFIFVLF